MKENIRLGVVPYLNAQPLVMGLDWPIVEAPPAELAALLKRRKVDVATVPIVELFEDETLYPVAGVGIGSAGAVRTVKFLSDRPPPPSPSPLQGEGSKKGEILEIQVDSESKTSVLLLKVILANHYGLGDRDVSYVTTPNPNGGAARLVIGDKAIGDEAPFELDLGEAWSEMTDLPFVYACWAIRSPTIDVETAETLRAVLSRNLAAIDPLTTSLADPARGWSAALIKEYLTRNIRYDLGPREVSGIRAFHAQLTRIGAAHKPFKWSEAREITAR